LAIKKGKQNETILAAAVLVVFLVALLCSAALTTIDLTNQVRGILPVANGGTGISSAATADTFSATLKCAAASASGTAYTCTSSPSFTPAAQDAILFKADVANTGSATLNVNSSSAKTIKKQGGGTNLVANDLLAGQWVTLVYDGTNWQMEGQSGNASAGGVSECRPNDPDGGVFCFWRSHNRRRHLRNFQSLAKSEPDRRRPDERREYQHRAVTLPACAMAADLVISPSHFRTTSRPGILLAFVVSAFGITSVTTSQSDSLSNTTSVGNGVNNAIYYTCSAVGGATSVTFTGGRSAQLHIYEVQGNATSTCLDANGTGGGSSVSVTSLSTATSGSVNQGNEFVLAAFNTNFSSATAITIGSGYQQEESTFGSGTASGNVALVSGQGNANSGLSGVQTATATTNLTASFWNGMVATFKLNTSTSTAPWTFRAMVCADLPAHIPCPIFAQTKTAQTSAVSDFAMATAPTGSQLYRFTGTVNCTTSSAAATATLNLKYTDTSNTAQTLSTTATCTSLGASSIANLVNSVRAKAATAVTYGVTIANTPTYDVDVRLEQLQ
jgi:hypothetical protein